MNPHDLVTSLPTSLSCNVLRDWLSLKSVVALDSAYCGKSKRKHFENLLRSNEYLIREEVTFSGNDFEQCGIWGGLLKFGRSLRSVAFTNELSDEQGRLVAQHCPNLTHVHFQSNYGSCAMRSILEANIYIEDLHLHFDLRNTMIPAGADVLSLSLGGMSLPNLSALAMFGNAFRHEHIVDALKMSNNIVRLDIYAPKISQSTILQLAHRCPHIKALGLVYAPLNDDILAHLTKSCSQIVHLDILNVSGWEENVGITDTGILAAVQNLPGLLSLNIKNNHNLTDASLVHIYTYCANTLRTLYFSCGMENGGGQLYGPEAIRDLLVHCTQLRTLYFGFYHEEEEYETGITLPATTLSNLKELVLSGNIASDYNLAAISRHGANLQVLGILGERSLYTQSKWMYLLEGCPKLTEVCVPRAAKQVMNTWAEGKLAQMVRMGVPAYLQRFDVLNM